MSTYAERKAARTNNFLVNQGKKTGSLVEIEDVKRFYQTESDSAQARIEAEENEILSANLIGEVNKYYTNDC